MKHDFIRKLPLGPAFLACARAARKGSRKAFAASRDFLYMRILRHSPKIGMREDAPSRQSLADLIDFVMTGREGQITMVEIGSYRGESAELFLKTGRVARIYCIDPWQPFYDKDDKTSFTDMESVERDFDARFANDARVVKVKGTVDDFVAQFCGADAPTIDFVYIDGCHTRPAVQHDIDQTLQHIHPRIATAGHDYWNADVKGVVNEMFGRPDKEFPDTSWVHFMDKS